MSELSVQWLALGLDVSVKAAVLAILAAVILKALRVRNCNVRHRVWCGVLAGMLLLPVLTHVVPALQLPFAINLEWLAALDAPADVPEVADLAPLTIPDDSPAGRVVTTDDLPLAQGQLDGASFSMRNRPGSPWPMQPRGDFGSSGRPLDVSSIDDPTEAAVNVNSPAVADTEGTYEDIQSPASSPHPQRFWVNLLAWLGALWLFGALAMTSRLLIGLWMARRLARESCPIDLAELAQGDTDELPEITRNPKVTLLECPLIRVPVTLGALRPRILLPTDWVDWPPEKLRAVLTHEHTHVERADYLVAVLAELNRCVYWFHPLAWWLKEHLSGLAEEACDDAAIDSTGDRARYAHHLLEVAASLSHKRGRVIPTTVSMARRPQVETRINAILDFTRPLSRRLTWGATLVLLATIIPLIAVAAALRPADERKADAATEIPADEAATSETAEPASIDQPTDAVAANPPPLQGGAGGVAKNTAQIPAETQEPAADPTYTFAGTVVDPNGTPVAGAKVSLSYLHLGRSSESAPAGTVSDEFGRFEFSVNRRSIPAANDPWSWVTTGVIAAKDGFGFDYLPASYLDASGRIEASLSKDVREQIEENAGKKRTRLQLVADDVPVRGQVVNLEGQPVVGARVEVQSVFAGKDRSLDAWEAAAGQPGAEYMDLWQQHLQPLAEGYYFGGIFSRNRGRNGSPSMRSYQTARLLLGLRAPVLPVTQTDSDGRFTITGLGRDRIAEFVVRAPEIETTQQFVRSRPGKAIELPLGKNRDAGSETFHASEFTVAIGPGATVIGRVVDQATGAPLEGVSVLSTSQLLVRAVTDAQGRYRLDGMQPAMNELLVAPPRHSRHLAGGVKVQATATSPPLEREIVLTEGTLVTGRAIDERTGKPVSARVQYYPYATNPGLKKTDSLQPPADVPASSGRQIDTDGQFEIPVLPGQGILAFRANTGFVHGLGIETIDCPRVPSQGQSDVRFKTTPPCRASGSNLVIAVNPKPGERELQVSAALRSIPPIPGRVLSLEGKPLADYVAQGLLRSGVWSKVAGDTFTIEGYEPTETRWLLAYHPALNLAGHVVLSGEPPERVEIKLAPAATLVGRILDSDGDPLEIPFIYSYLAEPGNDGRANDNFVLLEADRHSHSDTAGRFKLRGIIPGLKYRTTALLRLPPDATNDFFTIFADVTAEPGETKQLGDLIPQPQNREPPNKTAEKKMREAAKQKAQAAAQEAKPPIGKAGSEAGVGAIDQPASSNPAYTYAGTVIATDGKPVARAKIIAIATLPENIDGEAPPHVIVDQSETDSGGRFAVSLPAEPGHRLSSAAFSKRQYQIVAWAEGYGLDWQFVPQTAPATPMSLQLAPDSIPIEGRVLNLEGRPVPGVAVRVRTVATAHANIDEWIAKAPRTDPATVGQGTFSVAPPPPRAPGPSAWFPTGKYLYLPGLAVQPRAVTGPDGRFRITGMGNDRLVALVLEGESIATTFLDCVTHPMQPLRLPHDDPRHRSPYYFGSQFDHLAEPTQMVTGVVRDADSGSSLAGARISVVRLPGHALSIPEFISAGTDSAGKYQLIGLPKSSGSGRAGSLRVVPADADPYFPLEVSLPKMEGLGPVTRDIELKRAVWLTGRVTNKETGQPVPSLISYYPYLDNPHAAEYSNFKPGTQSIRHDAQFSTAPDGTFRIPAVPGRGVVTVVALDANSYRVAAGAAEIGLNLRRSTSEPRSLYHLHSPDLANSVRAVAIDENGKDAVCHVELIPLALQTVHMRDPDNQPLAGVSVVGTWPHSAFNLNERLDGAQPAPGDAINLHGVETDGRRRVLFWHKQRRLGQTAVIESGETPEIRLEPCATISGRLVDASGAPLAEQAVSATIPQSEFPEPSDARNWGRDSYRIQTVTTDAAGRFLLDQILPGVRYKIESSTGVTVDRDVVKPGETIDLGDLTRQPEKAELPKKAEENKGDATKDTAQPAARPPLPPLAQGGSDVRVASAAEGAATQAPGEVNAAPRPLTYSGRVTDAGGMPIGAATISLVYSIWGDTTVSTVHELARSDESGGFRFEMKKEIGEELSRLVGDKPKLVAKAPQYGLDWLPLEVFDDNAAASNERDLQRSQVDKALGAGRFAGRTLKLPPQDQPVRGRLVDLEGHPLRGVTILVEDISRPDIPTLMKAFQQSSKDLVYAANHATFYPWVAVDRSALQQLIPSVATDANGEFSLAGIGRDQVVTLSLQGERIDSQRIHILGRTMEIVRLPHLQAYPSGAKDVYAGYEFTYAVGPSVPVDGIVKDYDTGEPIAKTIVFVERLFENERRGEHVQLRLDCQHLRTVTDDKGRFRITGMPPGTGHVLRAIPPKHEPFLMADQVVSPNPTDRETEIEIRVKKAVWIEGHVTDKQTGEPIEATVDYLALQKNPHTLDKLGLRQAWELGRYPTDKAGRYRVPGLPGPGVVLVRAREKAGYPLSVGADTVNGYEADGRFLPTTHGLPLSNWNLIRQIEPRTDDKTFTCDLVLDAGQSVRGRVVTTDGKPVSELEAFGEVVNEAFWAPHANGTFTVGGYDGKGPRQLFFKSRDETLVGQFRLEGTAPPEIVVTLQPAVRVAGRLIDSNTNEPAQRNDLYCENTSRGKFRIADIFTDDEGRFEIKGLVPGVVYDIQPGDARNFINRNRFKIDLTTAKPGDIIDLGSVETEGHLRRRKKAMEQKAAEAEKVSPAAMKKGNKP